MSRKGYIESLIEEDLGYCCPYAFFSLYRETRTIVDRLGACRGQVKVWKAKHREGKLICKGKENCLKEKIPEARKTLHILRVMYDEDSQLSLKKKKP